MNSVSALVSDFHKTVLGGRFASSFGAAARLLTLVGVAALGWAALSAAYAQPGRVDPTFNAQLNGVSAVTDVKTQPDGKLIVACEYVGWGAPQGCVARLHANGVFDPSFKLGLGPADSEVRCVLVQPDGKIVVGGTFTEFNGVPCGLITRLNSDGTVDTSFDAGTGIGLSGGWWPYRWLAALYQQPGGRILLAGGFTDVAGLARTNFARLNPDGSPDATFTPAVHPTSGNQVAVQPDGTIYVAAGISLVRLLPDGSLDSTFKPELSSQDEIKSIALAPNGQILVSGSFVGRMGNRSPQVECSPRLLILRFNPDGSADPTFAPVFYSANLSCYSAVWYARLKVDSAGRIFFHGGFETLNGLPISFLARFVSEGTLDGNFDTGTGPGQMVQSAFLDTAGNVFLTGVSQFNDAPTPVLFKVIGGNPEPQAPRFKLEPVATLFDSGLTVALTSMVSGYPAPDFQWLRNGEALADATLSQLILTNMESSLAGSYQLRASNALGTVLSQSIDLLPPSIDVQPGPQAVMRSENASLSVTATNLLPLSFQWRFQGVDLPGATNATLVLTNVQPAQAGEYEVTVSNPLGAVTSVPAPLTVLPPAPPEILAQPQSQKVEEGVAVSFSVVATNYLPLTYQWLFNGLEIAGATQSNLTLPRVTPVHEGNYSARVSSEHLSVVSEPASLIVKPVEFVPGPGVVTNIVQADLEAALRSGAPVTFGVNGVIPLTNTIVISNDTTIDGTSRSITLDGQGVIRHFVVNPGATLRLVNLTLANGQFTGAQGATNQPGNPGLGGSIYSVGGTLELAGCKFVNNHTVGGNGGPVVCWNCIGVVTRGAPGLGGAIYLEGGLLDASGCVFADNSVVGGRGTPSDIYTAPGEDAYGGAVFLTNSLATFSRTTFTNNVAQGGELNGGRAAAGGGRAGGGALADAGGSTILFDCVLEANRALGATRVAWGDVRDTGSGNGGAIFHQGGTVSIDRAVFRGNHALGGGGTARGAGVMRSGEGRGGGIYIESGAVELRNSTLVANKAEGGPSQSAPWPSAAGSGSGGAIHNLGRLTAVNCTLTGNASVGGDGVLSSSSADGGTGYGGGIFVGGGEASLRNVTVAANRVQKGSYGGEPCGASIGSTNGTVTVTNTILSSSPGETNANVWGTIQDGGHNICSDGSAGFTSTTSRSGVDPLLGPLADNGGRTPTMALLPGSPALNAGDDAAAPVGDQRGVGRPAGAASDIGAFEVGAGGPLAITRPPVNATVDAGLSASFSVLVSTVPAEYQWQFNGLDLPGATNGVLFLNDVRGSQGGEYRVVVRDASGSLTSTVAVLTVVPPTPPVILTQPQGWTIPLGDPLVLSVSATNVLPLQFQWQRDGAAIPGATKAQFELNHVTADDAGIYTALVSTRFLSATSSPAIVQIDLFPEILKQPSDQQVFKGRSVSFSVEIRGADPLSFQWDLDGIEIPGATNATLRLDNVPLALAGEYSVKVWNALGEATSRSAELAVRESWLDPGFDLPSSVEQKTIGTNDRGTLGLAATEDGKVLVVGRFPDFMQVIRIHDNGTLDPGYTWPTDFAPQNYAAEWVSLAPGGRALAHGYLTGVGGLPRRYLARMNSDGSVDEGFVPWTGLPMTPLFSVVQPDGRILVGSVYSVPDAVHRLNPGGSLDTTFSPLELSGVGALTSILLQPDGRILVHLQQDTGSLLTRVSDTGAPDPGFNVRFGNSSRERVLAHEVQADGKVIAGGVFNLVNETPVTNLVRLNLDGSLDSTFRPAVIPDPVQAIAIEQTGKILVAGGSPGRLFRLFPDGSLDPTLQAEAEPISHIVPLEDGRVLIGGAFDTVDGLPRRGLARLIATDQNPRIADIARIGQVVRVALRTLTTRAYVLERTPGLGSSEWDAVQSIDGNGRICTLADTNAALSEGFYRVRVLRK